MKNIILLALMSATAFAGQLTHTTQEVDDAITEAGVWLYSSNGTDRTFYTNDFNTAYQNATSGDMIRLGVGTFDIGSQDFSEDGVSVIGSGMGVYDHSITNCIGGTILTIDDLITVTANNALYKNFSIKGNVTSTDLVVASLATPPSNVRFEQVLFSGHPDNVHNCQLSGTNITVRGCESYSAGFFGFVFKGGRNVLFEDCISGYNESMQFVIKASDDAENVTNAVIRGCTMYCDDSYAGVILNTSSQGYTMDTVDISGNTFYDASVGIYIQTPNTNGIVKNLSVRNNYAYNADYWFDAHSTGIEDCISSFNVIQSTGQSYRQIASSETNAVSEIKVLYDREIDNTALTGISGVFYSGE